MASASAVANAVGSSSSTIAPSSSGSDSTADKNVEIWKIKRLIKSLEAARGFVNLSVIWLLIPSTWIELKYPYRIVICRNGTSMISLIIPPKDQISRVSAMLANEFGTASNIKSRVNRLSVLGAITSVQQRLKLYNRGMRTNSCDEICSGRIHRACKILCARSAAERPARLLWHDSHGGWERA